MGEFGDQVELSLVELVSQVRLRIIEKVVCSLTRICYQVKIKKKIDARSGSKGKLFP